MTEDWDDSPVTVIPDCVVVVDFEALQVLDQAPLQVTAAGGFDSGVHQPIPPSHAVEVVLLGPQTRQKAVPYEPT